MSIRIVRLGEPKVRDEGTRLGTVRRPPRGVRKSRYAAEHYFDVWLPNLAPSATLMKRTKARGELDSPGGWSRFAAQYRSELNQPDTRRVLEALAALSHHTNFSVGCYCENERRCHRSVLRSVLKGHGAEIVPR